MKNLNTAAKDTQTNLLEEFKELLGITEDNKVHKLITRLYVEIRLKPLTNKYNINSKTFNELSDTIHKNYLTKDYSIDKMVDSVYNYVNQNKKMPTEAYIKDIEALLEDYYEEDLL